MQDARAIKHPIYRATRRTPLSALVDRHGRILARASAIGDLVAGFARDVVAARTTSLRHGAILSVERVGHPHRPAAARKWCLYAAYSPRAVVSRMVRAQLAAYRDAGYAVAFVSMSQTIAPEDRASLRAVADLIIQRRSHGRDFGAWAATLDLIDDGLGACEHLLLTNDSCLGPLNPLAPWIERAERRPGLAGLTENLGGGSHLQSYFLLANGNPAVTELRKFLGAMRLSHSKFLTVQRGEIALSAHMRRHGHAVTALIDHERLEHELLKRPLHQTALELAAPHLFKGQRPLPDAGLPPHVRDTEIERVQHYNRLLLRRRLFADPINPCYHLMPLLLEAFAFPFVKVDLVVRNPGRFPFVPDWRYAIAADGAVTETDLDDHLATLG